MDIYVDYDVECRICGAFAFIDDEDYEEHWSDTVYLDCGHTMPLFELTTGVAYEYRGEQTTDCD